MEAGGTERGAGGSAGEREGVQGTGRERESRGEKGYREGVQGGEPRPPSLAALPPRSEGRRVPHRREAKLPGLHRGDKSKTAQQKQTT